MNKKIGVIYCEGQGYYQTKLIRGISERAHELGYDVVVFTNFVKACHNIDIELCENNIFYLINFDDLEGVIVGADTLRQSRMETEIYEILKKKCKCPVVVVDWVVGHDYPVVLTDDSQAFAQLVSHMIEVHGCRDILFYSGPESIASTQSRLKGYKQALEAHQIEVRDELISFDGDFWYGGGEQAAREIIDGRRKKPDAIVFCGDYMAIGALNEFEKAGWRVPEDIRISGYDATDDALKASVPVTSYDPPVENTGIRAVNKLLGLDENERDACPHGLCIGATCGCEEDLKYTKRMYFNTSELDAMREFMASTMLDEVVSEEGFNALCKQITHFLFLIQGWQDFYLCLSGEWGDFADKSRESDFYSTGYSDTVLQIIRAEGDAHAAVDFERFDRSVILTDFYEEHAPKTYFLVPVYLGRKNYGYAGLTFTDPNRSFDSSFRNWIKHVALALEVYRNHEYVTDSVSKDLLTDAYTRVGFNQRTALMRIALMNPENSLMVAVIDVDGLKKINDTLGHDKGDEAIKAAANVIQAAKREQEIAVRTGGDEFALVGCMPYDASYEQELLDAFKREIDQYNAQEERPYQLSISIGVMIKNTNSFEDYEALYKEADQKMYEMKKRNHKARRG